jgi:hypothetical protein
VRAGALGRRYTAQLHSAVALQLCANRFRQRFCRLHH